MNKKDEEEKLKEALAAGSTVIATELIPKEEGLGKGHDAINTVSNEVRRGQAQEQGRGE